VKMPLIGPSSPLRVSKAEIRRAINMVPATVDSGTGREQVIAESIPGLVEFTDLGEEARGFVLTNDRAFVVGGNSLFELSPDGSLFLRGQLNTSTGPVGMDKNRDQIILADGANGYILTQGTNVFSGISDPSFFGSPLVRVLNQRAVFAKPSTDQFYWSELADASAIDASDFATAESSPDQIRGHIVDHGQLMLFGTEGGEVWDDRGGTDSPFVRNDGARLQVGCVAAFTLQQLDNTVFWLSQDKRGFGVVYRLSGYSAVRVSTFAVEQALQTVWRDGGDLTAATAYAYQQDGRSFYCLNCPGLETTWVYDTSTQLWHERAEFTDGILSPHRATCHLAAFGKHLVGSASGKIYELDPKVNTNAGDTLLRRLVSPHLVAKDTANYEISSMAVECDVGQGRTDGSAPLIGIQYSKNGGNTWSNWKYPNLGVVGDYRARPRIHRLGFGRDWVFGVQCTENTRFNVVGATVK
jgi:hypothetical protein